MSPPSGLGFCCQRTPWIGKVADIVHSRELNFSKEKMVPCVTDRLHLNSQGRSYLEISGEHEAHSLSLGIPSIPQKCLKLRVHGSYVYLICKTFFCFLTLRISSSFETNAIIQY